VSRLYARARVTTITVISRVHRIPRGSTPRVLVGQTVKATETLAAAEVAREHRIVDVVGQLNARLKRVESFLVKRVGDPVVKGETLASRRRFLRRLRVTSPIEGRVIRIEGGQMLLEGPRTRIEVEASVPGKIVEVIPDEAVTIETTGAAIQVAWGCGGLVWGTLKVMDETPGLETNPGRFNIDHRGAIVAIGSPVTEAFLEEAADIRVRGVIASSVHASLVPRLASFDFPIGITQGFGRLPMSERILGLLAQYSGREIAMDMGQIDNWRERRPEIIIPLASQQKPPVEDQSDPGKFSVGQRVRVLQDPYLGQIGTIAAIHDDPRRLPSGLWSEGIDVEFSDGEVVFVPFANFEHLG
jgi:hypothetical protein